MKKQWTNNDIVALLFALCMSLLFLSVAHNEQEQAKKNKAQKLKLK